MRGIALSLAGLIFSTVAFAQDAPSIADLQKTIQAQGAKIDALTQFVNALVAAANKPPKSALFVNAYPTTFDIAHSSAMQAKTRKDAAGLCRERFNPKSFATGLEQVSPNQVMFTCQIPDGP